MGRMIQEQTEQEIIDEIYRAKKLVAECLELNNIPIHVGLSALHSMIASTMKEHRDLEHYKDFMSEALELTQKHWYD